MYIGNNTEWTEYTEMQICASIVSTFTGKNVQI